MEIIIAIAVSFLIAFLICKSLKADMSNVALKVEASDFVVEENIDIEIRTDQFTHESVSRRKLDK